MADPERRVLVAEDDPALGSMIAEALSEGGFRAVRVPALRQAIERADEGPWAFFLIDGSGATHLEPGESERSQLAELNRLAPVVVMSGRTWAYRLSAEELGVAALLRKPFDVDELLRLAEEIASN